MFYKIKILTVLILAGVLTAACQLQAETWQIGADRIEKVEDANGQGFMLLVAELKEKINRGDIKAAKKTVRKLREDYPQQTAGEDFDVYIEAEMLLAENKIRKAVHTYEKLLDKFPKSGLYEAALEREFEIAADYLAGRKRTILKIFKVKGYAEGEKIMKRVMDRAGQSPLAARAGITLAESLEKREEYDQAYDIWSEINDIWSTGRFGRLSLLGMARVKYLSYNGPGYDTSCLVSAKSFYRDFQSRYPQRAEELKVGERIEDINEKIAYKKYEIAEYYKRTDSLQAANLYYRMVAEQWGDTRAGKLAREELN